MADLSYLHARDGVANPRYFEGGTALSRLLTHAPYLARCSDNKTAALVRPREWAVQRPYMQVNRSDMISWLVFDLDHSNAWVWDDAGLPAPNIIVRDPRSGRAHLYYAISPVCTSEKARPKPVEFMRAVRDAMTIALKADPQYHGGPIAKTPGHPDWQTTELHARQYELGTLADYLNLATAAPWANRVRESTPHSRHCRLFEQLRFHAYGLVKSAKKVGSFEDFSVQLEVYALRHNNFEQEGFKANLPLSSIRATVKSVARWTWERYTGSSIQRGVMHLDAGDPLAERQMLAALRTHTVRRERTQARIRVACEQLQRAGQVLTDVAIAGLAKLARRTVALYRQFVDQIRNATTAKAAQPSESSPPVASITPLGQGGQVVPANGQHAVHQIVGLVPSPTAPRPGPALRARAWRQTPS